MRVFALLLLTTLSVALGQLVTTPIVPVAPTPTPTTPAPTTPTPTTPAPTSTLDYMQQPINPALYYPPARPLNTILTAADEEGCGGGWGGGAIAAPCAAPAALYTQPIYTQPLYTYQPLYAEAPLSTCGAGYAATNAALWANTADDSEGCGAHTTQAQPMTATTGAAATQPLMTGGVGGEGIRTEPTLRAGINLGGRRGGGFAPGGGWGRGWGRGWGGGFGGRWGGWGMPYGVYGSYWPALGWSGLGGYWGRRGFSGVWGFPGFASYGYGVTPTTTVATVPTTTVGVVPTTSIVGGGGMIGGGGGYTVGGGATTTVASVPTTTVTSVPTTTVAAVPTTTTTAEIPSTYTVTQQGGGGIGVGGGGIIAGTTGGGGGFGMTTTEVATPTIVQSVPTTTVATVPTTVVQEIPTDISVVPGPVFFGGPYFGRFGGHWHGRGRFGGRGGFGGRRRGLTEPQALQDEKPMPQQTPSTTQIMGGDTPVKVSAALDPSRIKDVDITATITPKPF